MRASLMLPGLMVLSLAAGTLAYPQDLLWVRQTGGPSGDFARGVATDGGDNVYLVGSFRGTVDFDPGPGVFERTAVSSEGDLFLSKLDRDGRFVWARQIGGVAPNREGCVALDAGGNIYVVGNFESATVTTDFDPGPGTFEMSYGGGWGFVEKLDNAGHFVWARQFDAVPLTVATAKGSVYLAGYLYGTADLDPGPGTRFLTEVGGPGLGDAFVSKLDGNGSLVWVAQFGATGVEEAHGLNVDADGNVYSTGRTGGAVDFDPGPGVQMRDGNTFVSKLDADGAFVWATQFGVGGLVRGWAMALDAAGSVFTAGTLYYAADFDPGPGVHMVAPSVAGTQFPDGFVSKLDNAGNFVYAQSIGSATGFDYVHSMAVDSGGNLYAAGKFMNTVDFDPGPGTYNLTSAGADDAFVWKLDPAGNFVWAAAVGGPAVDWGGHLAVDSSGVILFGEFQGTADFDPGPGTLNLTSAGGIDTFVWKYGLTNLQVMADSPTSLRFTPDDATFDVVKGKISDLRASRDYSQATCMGSFDLNAAVDASVPPVGDAYYYVGRGASCCTTQGYGHSTLVPDPRDALSSSGPCP